MDEQVRSELSTQTNKIGKVLFLYHLCMILAGAGFAFSLAIEQLRKSSLTSFDFDRFMESILTNGWPSIFASVIGLLIIYFITGNQLTDGSITHKQKKMTMKSFILIFFCFMAAQPIISVLWILIENGFNILGYSISGHMEMATSVGNSFSMIFYASIIAPVFEEIIFRGVVLRRLENYGKVFAIVVSAILFGFMHANLVQGIFAVMVGLVLGYVTIEYSMQWAILLHFINNAIFGQLLGYIQDNFFASSDLLSIILFASFFIAALIIVIKQKEHIKEYLRSNQSAAKTYQYTFSSLWIVLFLAMNIVLAITGIQPL